MELTDADKESLLRQKEDMRIISNEIFDLHTNPNNKIEILKRMNQILNILSTISNYSDSNNELKQLKRDIYDIEMLFEQDGTENLVQNAIRDFCYEANSITFKFTKDGVKLQFADKIEHLHFIETHLKFNPFKWFNQ